ncbi:Uncharacterized protein TCM_041903 [Theobroma cacao]|uniref:Uncharacterized protein n=1 Tax=Theobroma cacao TaxID=3641 RepID=A0A061GXF2_THECC|nr:Uncharacterized protein TCM_041903 [Theobroma cacao]
MDVICFCSWLTLHHPTVNMNLSAIPGSWSLEPTTPPTLSSRDQKPPLFTLADRHVVGATTPTPLSPLNIVLADYPCPQFGVEFGANNPHHSLPTTPSPVRTSKESYTSVILQKYNDAPSSQLEFDPIAWSKATRGPQTTRTHIYRFSTKMRLSSLFAPTATSKFACGPMLSTVVAQVSSSELEGYQE